MDLIKTLTFPVRGDNRGSLIALEQCNNVPFDIKRAYFIFNTRKDVTRGLHAHKTLDQIAVCVSGSCRFLMDDGNDRETIILDRPDTGLLLPPMIWHEMYEFSEDCVLLILASELYNEADYIRDYNEFLLILESRIRRKSQMVSG